MPFFLYRVPAAVRDPNYRRLVIRKRTEGVSLVISDVTDMIVCNECDFVCVRKVFAEEELSGLYAGYRGPKYTAERTAIEPKYAGVAVDLESPASIADRNEGLWTFLRPILDNVFIDVLCDFGGADGALVPPELAERCGQVWVEDVSGVALAHERFRSVGFSAVGDRSVDMALCMHVLEHVGHPIEHARRVVSKVAPGGLVYLEVPLEVSLEHLERVRAGAQYQYIHEHINQFTPTSLHALARALGLDVIACTPSSMAESAGHKVVRLLAQVPVDAL